MAVILDSSPSTHLTAYYSQLKNVVRPRPYLPTGIRNYAFERTHRYDAVQKGESLDANNEFHAKE